MCDRNYKYDAEMRERDSPKPTVLDLMDTHELTDLIVYNAFNGMGDSSGSDDFGYSFAWIDLDDFVEMLDGSQIDTDVISKAMHRVVPERFAIAYLDANGIRTVVGYYTYADVLAAYRALDAEFQAFCELLGDEA